MSWTGRPARRVCWKNHCLIASVTKNTLWKKQKENEKREQKEPRSTHPRDDATLLADEFEIYGIPFDELRFDELFFN